MIKGSTFPMWLSGKRQVPSISYKILNRHPLKLLDIVTYQTNTGKIRKITGIDTFREELFVWRGKGVLKILTSKWRVIGLTDNILVIRFDASLVTPAGIDVLVRKGTEIGSLGAVLTNNTDKFGLTIDEISRLKWI
ncbi:hypothetical protein ACYSNR_01775 [Enterococcus sp. LJL128]|uniref:hypothetical protein n=1 Tax=Enterococcus sp. LJL51 TaxID=3416656 RepID=UPI003CF03392